MESLDIFPAFYNLRLRSKRSDRRDRFKLDPRDGRRLTRFLERYTPAVFRLTDKQAFDQFVAAREKRSDVVEIWGTLGYYEYKNGVNWFLSRDLEAFLADYRKTTGIIESYLDVQTVSIGALCWLNALGRLEGRSLIALRSDGSPFDGDCIDLNSHRIVESSGDLLDWHGIAISRIGAAIYKNLCRLLRGELTIKRCILPECDKIFVPSTRGRGSKRIYCSTSCRVRAYQNR